MAPFSSSHWTVPCTVTCPSADWIPKADRDAVGAVSPSDRTPPSAPFGIRDIAWLTCRVAGAACFNASLATPRPRARSAYARVAQDGVQRLLALERLAAAPGRADVHEDRGAPLREITDRHGEIDRLIA